MAYAIHVVHLAVTPLAGSPIRICEALNAHTPVRARLIVLDPAAYGSRTFDGDLSWNQDHDLAMSLLDECDIIHLHHWMELQNNRFGIDLSRYVAAGKAVIRQFHTHPMTIARSDRSAAKRIMEDRLPQLVLAQFQERFYPRARLVPNIVPLSQEAYRMREDKDDPVSIFFAPSVVTPAWESRWDTKGYPETLSVLQRVSRAAPGIRIDVRCGLAHADCLRARRASHIAIDEMVTGSFHLSSLEGLSQGVPTFAYLDSRTLQVLSEITGTTSHPAMNFRLEEAEEPLRELIGDRQLREEVGHHSRQWMETYWDDRQMVQHYVRAYEDLLERPEVFRRCRIDASSRRVMWLVQGRDDAVWRARRASYLTGSNNHGDPSSGNGCKPSKGNSLPAKAFRGLRQAVAAVVGRTER